MDAFFNKVKDEKEKINLTDTDCKLQKGENGKFFNGYNAQAVTCDNIIIASDITNNQSDRNELLKMMEKSDNNLKNLGIKEEQLKDIKRLGDAGYRNAEQIGKLMENGYDLYIRMEEKRDPEKSKNITKRECEIKIIDGEKILICPGKRKLTTIGLKKRQGNYFYNYYSSKKECKNCNYFGKCLEKTKQNGKRFAIKKEIFDNYEKLESIRKKLKTTEGKDIYNQRIGMIERVFGQLKSNVGFKKFYHRSLKKVSVIWSILCTSYNISKICSNRKVL